MYKSTSGFPRPLLTTKAYPDMTCEAPLNLTLFRPEGVIMLADVRTQVELMLAGNERRDTLSAFNVLAARSPVDLGATPATARSVRELFAAVSPAALGVSAKRYANIRSLIVRAVDRFGMKRTRLTSRVPLAPEWEELLSRVENATYRQGVKRLAHYCSAMGIPPEEVRSEPSPRPARGARGRVHDQAPAQGHQAHDRHVEPLRPDGARLARDRARLALRLRAGHAPARAVPGELPRRRGALDGADVASRTRSTPRRRSGR